MADPFLAQGEPSQKALRVNEWRENSTGDDVSRGR